METPEPISSNECNQNKTQTLEALKQKLKPRGRKRKRSPTSDSSTDMDDILAANALEVEKNLHASAIKNNLDDASVKKIIKKVVTNDHVLAFVKLKEEEEEDFSISQYPKLTRAKVKELMKVSPRSAPWNLENLELTPIKHIPVKTRPEVEALIAQELPDDEDDDEYQPTQEDVQSDDDQTLESCSDLDSMPRTPATPQNQAPSPMVVKDGPFKIPSELKTPVRRRLEIDEPTIALRTRSKINLSATTIEHIESSFVPPDDIPVPVVDNLWNEFLLECLNPASNSKLEDDDEADPEYNVAADPDAHEEDEEALENSIIKISKKELNDLVTELFSVMPEDCITNINGSSSNGHLPTSHWEGKQEPLSDEEGPKPHPIASERRISFSIGKTEPEDIDDDVGMDQTNNTSSAETNVNEEVTNNSGHGNETNAGTENVEIRVDQVMASSVQLAKESLPTPPPLISRLVTTKVTQQHNIIVGQHIKLLPEQVLLLEQQLRQHIQLATSNYLQLYVHPEHWSFAPTYREFLESLHKISETRSDSIVNVCNLKPAFELMTSWEKSVSTNTPENMEMVEFIQQELDRNRRRASGNWAFAGDFHETYKKVVANSTVFLYPYLLPAMPYRGDHVKKFAYHRSEDSLLALGIDQFWEYIENNRDIFKPGRYHPRHRWGLRQVVQLVNKHMMPWYTEKMLLAHINFVRKQGDKDNPINKYFAKREIEPVSHKLLPFNPELTLYEQPEHEMPRLWVRYLSKSSKRFRDYYYKRSSSIVGQPLNGVPINAENLTKAPKKDPLPIQFTKVIKSFHADVRPVVPAPPTIDRVDLIINKENQEENAGMFTISICTANDDDRNKNKKNLTEPKNIFEDTNELVINEDIEESAPINHENINGCEQEMVISDNPQVTTKTQKNKNETTARKSFKANKLKDVHHCKCCIMLRRICKERQTMITEYFRYKNSKIKMSCPCVEIRHPRISNRLRLLTNLYKTQSKYMFRLLLHKLKLMRRDCHHEAGWVPKYDLNDITFVMSYQMRLNIRTGIARNNYIKQRIHTLLSRFDPDNGNPVLLAEDIFKAFHIELIDMYQEFLGFLTAAQADQIDHFREYFVHNCMPELVKKIEEEVKDKSRLFSILTELHKATVDKISTACDTCYRLLNTMQDLPELARYTFSLFPHNKKHRCENEDSVTEQQSCFSSQNGEINEVVNKAQPDTQSVDISNKENFNVTTESLDETNRDLQRCLEAPENINHEHPNTTKVPDSELDIDTPDLTITKTEIQCESCDESSVMSTMVMSDDESIKTEVPDWTRDEDKLILEILKDVLTPDDIKDKTILEILVEKNVVNIISDSLEHKSVDDIQARVIYLLQLLVVSDT